MNVKRGVVVFSSRKGEMGELKRKHGGNISPMSGVRQQDKVPSKLESGFISQLSFH